MLGMQKPANPPETAGEISHSTDWLSRCIGEILYASVPQSSKRGTPGLAMLVSLRRYVVFAARLPRTT